MRCVAAGFVAAFLSFPSIALAAGCAGNPNAIGTSRVIAIDPADHTRIGSMQYPETLPLADKEVVLTFDDGPLPRSTAKILDTLASECVKATFFMVGGMARAYPEWVRRVYNAGHTVGTHSYDHPRFFRRLSYERGISEIERGIDAVETALGNERALAPFFRFPGFGSTHSFEAYLIRQGIMVWGADVPADDWKHISAAQIRERALSRLERKGRGVLLLHDIQPATAEALPDLLRDLKERGFRIVHVVAAGPGRPKTVTDPTIWAFNRRRGPAWPAVPPQRASEPPAFSVPSALSFGFPYPLAESIMIASFDGERPAMSLPQAALVRTASARIRTVWPRHGVTAASAVAEDAVLPGAGLDEVNAPTSFGGKKFVPEAAPAAGQSASLEAATKIVAPPRRKPRQSRVARPANARLAAGERPASASWARSLNWSYSQPQ